MANRIRELRNRKGMTAEELAARADISQPYLTRLESGKRGKRGLTEETARKIAAALDADVAEVLGIATGNSVAAASTAFREDAAPYDAQDDELLRAYVKKRPNVTTFKIKTNALSRLDIHAGDVVFIDMSAEAVENVEPLKPVIAQHYRLNALKAVTIVRQFVPPSLLITNSHGKNEASLDLDNDPVAIKGVIIAHHRSLRS